jgi:hypothetical protein
MGIDDKFVVKRGESLGMGIDDKFVVKRGESLGMGIVISLLLRVVKV